MPLYRWLVASLRKHSKEKISMPTDLLKDNEIRALIAAVHYVDQQLSDGRVYAYHKIFDYQQLYPQLSETLEKIASATPAQSRQYDIGIDSFPSDSVE